MMTVPAGIRIHLALGPTDMRKGFDGLALLVQEVLRADPFSGHLFLFRGKRASAVKILFHDGTGMCLFAKRLDQGAFTWPATQPQADGTVSVTLTPAQLSMLLEGLEWRAPVQTRRLMIAG
ncbi:MAG: IS66 family insertion sequence element accessory protein TnpB [Janthinobacterium lividum]